MWHNEEIELEAECDAELESKDLSFEEIVNSTIGWASSPSSLDPEPLNLTSPSLESSLSLELKALPKHLKYAYLGEQKTLPVIVVSHQTDGQEKNPYYSP